MFKTRIEKGSNRPTAYDYYNDAFKILNEFKVKFNLVIIDVLKSYNDCQFAVSLESSGDDGWTKSICDIGFYFNANLNWTYFTSNTDNIADFTEKYNYLNDLCNKYFN